VQTALEESRLHKLDSQSRIKEDSEAGRAAGFAFPRKIKFVVSENFLHQCQSNSLAIGFCTKKRNEEVCLHFW
jgi:hypothetical protein